MPREIRRLHGLPIGVAEVGHWPVQASDAWLLDYDDPIQTRAGEKAAREYERRAQLAQARKIYSAILSAREIHPAYRRSAATEHSFVDPPGSAAAGKSVPGYLPRSSTPADDAMSRDAIRTQPQAWSRRLPLIWTLMDLARVEIWYGVRATDSFFSDASRSPSRHDLELRLAEALTRKSGESPLPSAASPHFTRAEELYARAFKMQTEDKDEDAPRTAVRLGMLAQLRGDRKTAKNSYRQALEIAIAGSAPWNQELVWATRRFNILEPAAKTQPTTTSRSILALQTRALDMSNSFTEEQHRLQCLAAASNLSEVGNMLESRGELQMAEKLYQRAWEINEKNAGPKASSTGVHLIQLARICLLQNKFSDAEARYRKAMSMYVMNPEETDAELASALEGYAWVLSTKRLSKQAEQVYEQARAARKRIDYSGF